ncbi:MAG TPA: 8-amino-7-oxononanoate synthase [Thermoanaerobaculia bacterium]|nr:8-amino-7-oxononanoate synthase [Thermoanaerobaculia bacterium]
MKPLVEDLAGRLRELAAQGLARSLRAGSGIDFSSNDYLGLARDPALRAALLARLAALGPDEPLGAPASRLLRGHTPLHEELERRLAAWKGAEAALLFPSGYQANVGVLSALVGRHDRALSDAGNHASLIDGLRLAGCRRVVFPHLDVAAVERELAVPHREGRTFLVTESLFSMDGDAAPLDRYAALAERHGAELIVDEAHASGLFGEARGSGLCELHGLERRVAATVSTLGKALGLAGACVAGPRVLVEYLVNRCRSFVFTTAPPPLLLHALAASLDRVEAEPGRRRRVLGLAGRLRGRLAAVGIGGLGGVGGLGGGGVAAPLCGPIVPVVLGDNFRALAVAERLQRQGFDVRAIRPPTVPPGTARLRISVHADHSEAEIDALANALAAALGEVDGRPARVECDSVGTEAPARSAEASEPGAAAR